MAPGDLRLSANQRCQPALEGLTADFQGALARCDATAVNLIPRSEITGHSYLDSQAAGVQLLSAVDPDAPLAFVFSAWAYAHHAMPILMRHRGPVGFFANWSGKWPGLVGMLQQRATATKFGIPAASLWADSYRDETTIARVGEWLRTGKLEHNLSHLRGLNCVEMPDGARQLGQRLAADLRSRGAILGLLDEGCMGMEAAILPDHLLVPLGIFKEHLSQSSWHAATLRVIETEADLVEQCYQWLLSRGMKFHFGQNEESELTEKQVRIQCAMYIAVVRLVHEFKVSGIGIQYQQGLKDCLPASDLVEGLLKSADRFPVPVAPGSAEIIQDGQPVLESNEVDQGSLLDALMNRRVHEALGLPLEQTLHDLRYGDEDQSGTTQQYIWVAEISGSAPAGHCSEGWAGCEGFRQPPMYFRLGGSTVRNIAKPGSVVYSRLRVIGDRVRPGCPTSAISQRLRLDVGVGEVVSLPREETERRWNSTTPEWPIMHLATPGASRDQIMADWGANHWQVIYGKDRETAFKSAKTKAAMAEELGLEVVWVGSDEKD